MIAWGIGLVHQESALFPFFLAYLTNIVTVGVSKFRLNTQKHLLVLSLHVYASCCELKEAD